MKFLTVEELCSSNIKIINFECPKIADFRGNNAGHDALQYPFDLILDCLVVQYVFHVAVCQIYVVEI